ncbi:MAG: hypothetical protein QXT19_00145 [Candidatus Woesearchaeota archaeon]
MLENIVKQLVELAKAEKWDEVDAKIPKVCNDSVVIRWAYTQGLYDCDDANVRDLAASILEKADWPKMLDKIIRRNLLGAFRTEKHTYARFRMACALYGHKCKTGPVKAAIEEAPKDVQKIAQKYLKR